MSVVATNSKLRPDLSTSISFFHNLNDNYADTGGMGDWEIDTVLGKYDTVAMVKILERKTRLYVVKKVPSKSAGAVTKELEGDVYFAYPYSCWERGDKENSIGLLRQYVKEGTDLTKITNSNIEFTA